MLNGLHQIRLIISWCIKGLSYASVGDTKGEWVTEWESLDILDEEELHLCNLVGHHLSFVLAS